MRKHMFLSLSLAFGLVLTSTTHASAAPDSTKKVAKAEAVSEDNDDVVYTTFLHEITGGATAGMGYEHTSVDGDKTDLFTLGITGGYRHMILSPMLQIGGEMGLAYGTDGDVSATAFTLLVGPTVNFGGTDLRNMFYAEARLGVAVLANSVDDNTDSRGLFAWKVGGGKRFRITDSIAYMPGLYLSGTAGDGSSVALTLNALSFSFFL